MTKKNHFSVLSSQLIIPSAQDQNLSHLYQTRFVEWVFFLFTCFLFVFKTSQLTVTSNRFKSDQRVESYLSEAIRFRY